MVMPTQPSNSSTAERDSGHAGGRELSALRLLTALLQHRRLIIATTLLVPLAVGTALLLKPHTYTARASFIPYVKSAQSSLSGLAAQLGVSVPGGDPTQSVYFYADLLRSNNLLGSLVDMKVDGAAAGSNAPRTLMDVLVPSQDPPTLRRDRAIQKLRSLLHVATAEQSGIITVAVTLESPRLAHATAERAIALVNDFNVARRRSQASAEREFAERRVAELRAEVAVLNQRWLEFLRRNRGYQTNFEQSFENDKLMREAEAQKGVLALMLNSFEQARMDEVRNTPVITVVDRPAVPTVPDSRDITLKTFLGLLAGLAIGVVIALWAELARLMNRSGAESEFRDYAAARAAALDDLRRVGRPILHVVSRRRASSA